jgi:inner membrane transporter RhtA
LQDDRDSTASETGTSSSQTGLAVLMVVASMVSVQLGAAFAHPTMASFGPIATTWGRLTWAAIIVGLIVRPDIRRYRRDEILLPLAMGAVIAVMTLCFFVAITRVALGLVVAIQFLGPLSVAAFGFARSWRLIWLFLAFFGVLLVVRDAQGWSIDLVGLGFAIAAGTGWGIYILLNKRIGKVFKGFDGLAISFVAAALFATPFGLWGLDPGRLEGLALETIGLAILTPLLPFVLEMAALRRMSSASFGILMSAEPAIGALAGFLILHEPLSPQQIAGIAFVISASAGAVLSTRDPG